jgi:hydrogenase/urease accessory protein HupE
VSPVRWLSLAVVLGTFAVPAQAHEVRPAYLEVTQTGPETYDLAFKVPGKGDLRLRLQVRLPQRCVTVGDPIRFKTGDAFVDRWTVRCPGGLTGDEIAIDGLNATLTDALVRFQRSDGTTQIARLTPAAPRFVVTARPGPLAMIAAYAGLGIEHILFGMDHLLFVLGLLLLVRGGWSLVQTITAFTVAHSITLALATLGAVHVSPGPVEAVIALSILFVGLEAVHARQGCAGIAYRWPALVAFAFGLLHGIGFAGALTEMDLPAADIPLALVFFNVGVEIGQLAFVGFFYALLWSFRRLEVMWPAWTRALPAYAIGSLAALWLFDRSVPVIAKLLA